MKIRKAVITAAGRNQRTLPLQTLVDRDGETKSALQIVLQETVSAGIEEIGLVVQPGDRSAYTAAAGALADRLRFVDQDRPLGYGYAIYCARDVVGNESFLHVVSDHLFVSRGARSSAQQLIDTAAAEGCAVSGVQATRESMLPYYGAVGGRLLPGRPGGDGQRLYQVEDVLEKPTPTLAEQRLAVPGLRAGQYLCFFGLHVLTPAVMAILGDQVRAADPAPIQLSPALAALAARERYLALEVHGERFDIGRRYGLLVAQLALALTGRDREEVLAQMLELVATRQAQ
jgi:UTP--glucose-1-phosphate uridylyltransferase